MRSNRKKGLAPRESQAAAAQKNGPAKGAAGAKAKAAGKAGGFKLTLMPERKPSGKMKSDDITFVFRNLATLIENGVSLPKALGALAEERALERCRDTLNGLRSELESGSTFSAALAKHKASFDIVTINQVRVGERSGTLPGTLDSIATQREKSGKLRAEVLKKLAYPGMLMVVGVGVIGFLLTYVVPVFEETYSSAKVPLPGITQTMILVGAGCKSYGLFVLGGAVLLALAAAKARQRDAIACRIDSTLLKLPLVGEWLRDIAVLEFMEVLGNLMEAGFTLAEALDEAAASVGNRVVKRCATNLNKAVNRGERFSREVENLGDLFPPIVSQLVIVGEQTGNLAKATRHIRSHLQEEVERRTNIFVGVIEPTLTATLATAVAVILMAIYLPMFDMINAVG
ncbi:MAG: type II secretion system F family protein [Planctomycetota bacterium]